jgi:hypothetical protein
MTNRGVDLARGYLKALSERDGTNGSLLFAPDAVLDDFAGGRWAGREAIEYFLNEVPEHLVVDGPLSVIEDHDGERVTCFGTVGIPGWGDPARVRWIFLIRDGLILHLCNTNTLYLHGIEPRPEGLNPRVPETGSPA